MRMSNVRRSLALVSIVALPLLACSSEDSDSKASGSGGASSTGGGKSSGGSSGTGAVAGDGGAGEGGAGGSSGSGGGSGNAGGASTDGGGSLCTNLGWCQITNTQLASVCPDPAKYPDIQANEGCSAVINDWNGGIAEPTRDCLIVWGCGHVGYFGNEVCALDLNTLLMKRLNEPSSVTGYDFSDCYAPDAYPDGRPSSRHTYDALAYIAHTDQMFSFSGAKAPCGYQGSDTWTLDLKTVETAPLGQAAPWALKKPANGPTGGVGYLADYEPNDKLVILSDLQNLWSYDVATDSYAKLGTAPYLDYHLTGRVDPKRRLFIAVGAGSLFAFDLSSGKNHDAQNWTSQVSGCDGLLSASYPGFAYDPDQDRLVGWAGGDTIYAFNPDTKSCTTVSYSGGPGAQNPNGTMGRFRYFPSLKVFAVVNDWQTDAFALRLTQ